MLRLPVMARKIEIALEDIRYKELYSQRRSRLPLADIEIEFLDSLKELVPAVWLPVSRRLPITDDDDNRVILRRHSKLETVDVRLRELIKGLSHYRLSLDARLSKCYKDFEKKVLQIILYNKKYDKIASVSIDPPKPDEKKQLLKAFEVAGLLDTQMKDRINEHFLSAEDAFKRMQTSGGKRSVQIEDIFIIPLIGRTKSLVQFAQELEKEREELFKPLKRFENIVNSYLINKNVEVSDNGEIKIFFTSDPDKMLNYIQLSSGEKQILILLIQALLTENIPVVYVADEPELSLHVSWQEKLIKSLTELCSQIQIIVATHSPDIVGEFVNKVIKLGNNNGNFSKN